MAWRQFTIPLAEQTKFYARIADEAFGPDEVELAGLEYVVPGNLERTQRLIRVTSGTRVFHVDATHDGDWIEQAAAVLMQPPV